jgi:hypothetical protein
MTFPLQENVSPHRKFSVAALFKVQNARVPLPVQVASIGRRYEIDHGKLHITRRSRTSFIVPLRQKSFRYPPDFSSLAGWPKSSMNSSVISSDYQRH